MSIKITADAARETASAVSNIHSWAHAHEAGVISLEGTYAGIAREVHAAEAAGLSDVWGGAVYAAAAQTLLTCQGVGVSDACDLAEYLLGQGLLPLADYQAAARRLAAA